MHIFSKVIGLGCLLASLGVFSIKAQETPSLFDINVDDRIYTYETSFNLGPNIVFRIIVPHNDTIYVGNKTWFADTRALRGMGDCVFDSLNPRKVSIDSVAIFVAEKGHIKLGTMLHEAAESKVVNRFFVLASGDTLVLREVFRRNFECSASVWFMIRPLTNLKGS